MKNILLLISAFIVFGFCNSYAQYSSPESVTYDPVGKRYFISNTGSGKIVQRSQAGVVTDFVTVGGTLRGITVHGNRIYAASSNNVKGYDLTTALEVFTVNIPGSSLNDIAADTNGYLYVSNFHGTNRFIYKVNPANSQFWQFATVTRQPNGVYVDYKRNRLLVASWGGGAIIEAVKLNDSTNVTTAGTTSYSNFDGISLDRNDHVYLSSYGAGVVVRYDINFSTAAVQVSNGHSSAADIFVNRLTDTLAVPNAGSNSVSFVPLTIPTGISNNNNTAEGFKLYQNYPNPFNPGTIINYELRITNFVSLAVYDINGKMVKSLVSGKQNAGNYSVTFDGTGIPSGVYFYELKTGDFTDRKKMLLVK